MTVAVSDMTASEYAHDLAGPGVSIVVGQGGRAIGSTLPDATPSSFAKQGTVTVGGVDYRAVTQAFAGFGGHPFDVTVLSNLSATASSLGTSRVVAAIFIAAFLLLAFAFTVLASRALQGQIKRFLDAARRLGSGDFTARVPTEGHDEFARLARSSTACRASCPAASTSYRRSARGCGTRSGGLERRFASNLDRPALLELALRTAVDAVQASCGRLSVRLTSADPLAETVRGGLARRLRRAGPRRGALGAVPRRAGGGRVRSDERRVGRARPN